MICSLSCSWCWVGKCWWSCVAISLIIWVVFPRYNFVILVTSWSQVAAQISNASYTSSFTLCHRSISNNTALPSKLLYFDLSKRKFTSANFTTSAVIFYGEGNRSLRVSGLAGSLLALYDAEFWDNDNPISILSSSSSDPRIVGVSFELAEAAMSRRPAVTAAADGCNARDFGVFVLII